MNSAGPIVYIADSDNSVIRKVDLSLSTPTIATVAGDYSLGAGYSGDGSAATGAKLSYSTDITLDGSGDLFIADMGNNVIREVDHSRDYFYGRGGLLVGQRL